MFFGFEAIELARFQFALMVSAHIIFPAFTIGLASYLAVLEGLWLRTGDDAYLRVFDYWKTIFAVVFGMGVVSGTVMSYQFGTNWSVFSDKTGPVIGPLMGYEVLSAFFLEAGFLGVMLFGRNKVGPGLHFFATLMVAVGTLFSAFWILSVNSWMQTPAGYALNDAGQFVPDDWWAVIFNPSFPYRLVHMVLAAYLTTAFVVGAVGAWHLLGDRTNRDARIMFSMAMWMALIVASLQIVAGDFHGLNTLEHQSAKVAAMEGHYEGHPEGGAPLIVFGIPDDQAATIRHTIEIPYLSSLILTHELTSALPGLKDFPAEDRPPAELIFWTFRIMVAVGFAMVGLGVWSAWARWRGRLDASPWLHRAAVAMGPSGFLAVLCGWITTEVGRQPWTVQGLLRTADSVSPLAAPAVGYALLGATWLVMKTEGAVQRRARGFAWIAGVGTLGLIGLVSLATPFLEPAYHQRWFAWPTAIFSLVVPVLVLGCGSLLFSGLRRHAERQPFFAALGLFVLCFIGIGISFYPDMVPPDLTIWEAAAPDASLAFLLAGPVVLIPMILGYTAYAYWVFRGKVDAEGGYH